MNNEELYEKLVKKIDTRCDIIESKIKPKTRKEEIKDWIKIALILVSPIVLVVKIFFVG